MSKPRSRSVSTAKRHAKILAACKHAAIMKPEVASIGTGKAKSGFSKKVKGKQSKGYRTSSAPTNNIRSTMA